VVIENKFNNDVYVTLTTKSGETWSGLTHANSVVLYISHYDLSSGLKQGEAISGRGDLLCILSGKEAHVSTTQG
jgi:hypothetical protein